MLITVAVTNVVGLAVYGLVAVSGYLSFGAAVADGSAGGNIVANYPSSDLWMSVGRLALTVHLLCASPIYVSIGRRSFSQALFNEVEVSSLKRHVAIGIAFVGLSSVAGALMPNVGVSAEFTGALFATTISVTLPSFFYFRLFSSTLRWVALAMTLIGVTVTVVAVVLAALSLRW
jgi:amino acid permease